MAYIADSEKVTGYRVKTMTRGPFNVSGYTLIVPPGEDRKAIPQFWIDVTADGRLDKLRNCSSEPPWLLGLGSWDPECEENGQRYTICLKETQATDFTELRRHYPLFKKEIGASDWLCFELTQSKFDEHFPADSAYEWMGKLGYEFHKGDYSVGLHFDAYPPGFGDEHTSVEFWITVTELRGAK